MRNLAGHSGLALAKACIPEDESFGGADAETVAYAESVLRQVAPLAMEPWRWTHGALETLAFAQTGRHLSRLSRQEVQELLLSWTKNAALAGLVQALSSVYKIAHFDRLDVRGALRRPLAPVLPETGVRWKRNLHQAFGVEEEIECDVVVVGTGAGGAVVGRNLAARGYAVVFAEEGEYVGRGDFPGHFVGSLLHLYKTILTLGNVPVLIPRGRLVGGSTAVNGASTFRPPRWVTQRWSFELGSREFSTEGLEFYFRQVEEFLQVQRASVAAAGPFHELFSRGCESLGWHHELMLRNAPGCRGEGFCDNGCRSGARRSTDVSYIPDALSRGAVLLTGLRVDKILVKNGHAYGVSGTARSQDAQVRPVKVKARSVVLSCGALATPELLLRQDLANASKQVGRNLTIHPSGASFGVFDKEVDVARYIPQAEFSSQFLHEGILIVSAQPDEHMLPAMLPLVGESLMKTLAQRKKVAGLGFLAADCSHGRVRLAPGGRALVTYHLGKSDVRRLQRAHEILAELFLASGARAVFPSLNAPTKIVNRADLLSFRQRSHRANQFVLTAFHPLGTCRMSQSQKDGVVDLNHETHGVKSLFIVDGSVISGPLGVNPQLSIMAIAARASERIEARLERMS